MNTLWLKIAGLALIVVVAIVLVGKFTSSDSETTPPAEPRTFHDQVEDDKKNFSAEPQPIKELAPNQQLKQPERSNIARKLAEIKEQEATQPPPEENLTPAKPAQPSVLYFKPLDEIEKIRAEKLLNVAVPGRSIGRLPHTGFKLMVESCRRIISEWPDSWYAYRAKQMLADMPERFRKLYKITEQELDVSKFAKRRPGTEPFNAEDTP